MSEVKTDVAANNVAADVVSPKPPIDSKIESKYDRKKFPGLQFRRYFTKSTVSPYETVEWELRTASITDSKGNDIFRQENVESPKDWSMTATNIVACEISPWTREHPRSRVRRARARLPRRRNHS